MPAAWRTLYELTKLTKLTKLTDEQFADGIKTKLINPKMERKAIDDLRVVCRKNAKALKLINEEIGPSHTTALTSSEEITMLCPRRYRATARPTPSAASSATGLRHCEDAGRTSSTATAHVLRNE